MKKFLKLLDKYLEEFLLALFLIIMVMVMGLQIMSRYILGISLYWSEELTRYLFIWTGFLSISFCIKHATDIKIDQIYNYVKPKILSYFKKMIIFIQILFFIYLIPFAWHYFVTAILTKQTSPAMQIPMYLVQIAPFISFILAILRLLQIMFKKAND